MKIFQINFIFYKKLILLSFVFSLNPLFLGLSQAKESPSPNRLVVFKSGTASACGFFGRLGGKTYIFTSMHGLGSTGFNLFMKDGQQLKTGTVELASDRDMVRISTDETPGSFFEIDSNVQMAQAITIFNATADPKKTAFVTEAKDSAVNGIGPEFFSLGRIDKSSYALSGSPAINNDGKVIGIISSDLPIFEKADPAKPAAFIKVDWGNAVCSRFSDDIKWIAVNKQDLAYQLKTLADSRNLIDDYVSVACMWYQNPYGKIEIATPRVEIKPWLDEHNKKMENSVRNMANIAKDPNHFQDLAKQMQETARSDGMRFSSFASNKATALRNSGMTPYMKYYNSGMSSFFDEISARITAKTSTLTYTPPSTSAPAPKK